eukprot:scaffold14634_cov112-Isochrysis_galbana.AAC.5
MGVDINATNADVPPTSPAPPPHPRARHSPISRRVQEAHFSGHPVVPTKMHPAVPPLIQAGPMHPTLARYRLVAHASHCLCQASTR